MTSTPFVKPENIAPQEDSPAEIIIKRSSAATAIKMPAGCLAANAAAFLVSSAVFFAVFLVASAAAFRPSFLCRLCILAFYLLFLHETGKRVRSKLWVVVQGLVILEVDVCLKCCLFCFCRFPVGFPADAGSPVLIFLSRTLRRARQVPPIYARPLHRNCLSRRCGFYCEQKYPLPARGGITGYCGVCRRVWAFPVPQSAGGSLPFRWLPQRCALLPVFSASG